MFKCACYLYLVLIITAVIVDVEEGITGGVVVVAAPQVAVLTQDQTVRERGPIGREDVTVGVARLERERRERDVKTMMVSGVDRRS